MSKFDGFHKKHEFEKVPEDILGKVVGGSTIFDIKKHREAGEQIAEMFKKVIEYCTKK